MLQWTEMATQNLILQNLGFLKTTKYSFPLPKFATFSNSKFVGFVTTFVDHIKLLLLCHSELCEEEFTMVKELSRSHYYVSLMHSIVIIVNGTVLYI